MDLISREAAIEACIEVSKQEEKHSKIWAAGLRYAKRILTEVPSATAVPLEPLAKWLAEHAVPPVSGCCITTEERTIAWEAVLNKFVEEKDEAD